MYMYIKALEALEVNLSIQNAHNANNLPVFLAR